MNLLIAGATGFIGEKLVETLQVNHHVTVLGRDIKKIHQHFSQPVDLSIWQSLPDLDAHQYDAVINLCGYNIADSRWSPKVKETIIQSRVETTSTLVNWIIKQKAHPRFICANAVGIYGMQDTSDPTQLDEDSPIDFKHPRDFMSEIGIRWQQALQPAIDYGLNVSSVRFGVVLGYGKGILKKLSPSFYMGLGSIIGDGNQIMSWIHIEDVVEAIIFLLNRPDSHGVFNLTSPHPVRQAEFARALAKTMNRPLLLKIPAFLIRFLLGEMGYCLLLKGQRVMPTRLLKLGYKFRYPNLLDALRHEYN